MKTKKSSESLTGISKSFAKINGKHDLQKIVPDAYILYKARQRKGGKVAFFHFDLAKEMGLIPKSHKNEMTTELEEEILKTFSLVIINEYDLQNKVKIPKEDVKENFYMATRYLQLQHKSNLGLTSGDGRSIWNGQISHKGKTWDISSCGTGATRLSPATSQFKKFFKTGDPSISYGCGYAELDEGVASVLMSEIFYKNQIPTERVLAVIKFPNNLAITVRAYPNLLRPSHFFLHLKQNNLESVKRMTDFYIERQIKNKEWENVPTKKKAKYQYFLDQITERFANISAILEDEYIFCWMDWDGDNILMDGAVIDYGSIRQFGLFHHEYRYDDDDRYSTSIVEQKKKARYIVQCFVQMVDYINTGVKKPIKSFSQDKNLKKFDDLFQAYKNKHLVYKMGFNKQQREFLIKNKSKDLDSFKKAFSYFEMANSKDGITEVPDGITCNAIYSMRDILRELPSLLGVRGEPLKSDEFLQIAKSSYATKKDLAANSYRDKQSANFQKNYMKLVNSIAKEFSLPKERVLLEMSMRSSVINKLDRITGDSISCIVEEIMQVKSKLTTEDIYSLMAELANYQDLRPEKNQEKADAKKSKSKLLKLAEEVIKEYREGI